MKKNDCIIFVSLIIVFAILTGVVILCPQLTEYEYKVIKTVIVKPKNVNDTYVEFGDEDKEYITLMWCYPIWRTDKRMMVFAEKI